MRYLREQRCIVADAINRHIDVTSIEIDQRAIAAKAISDKARRAGTGEGVQDAGWETPSRRWSITFTGWFPTFCYMRMLFKFTGEHRMVLMLLCNLASPFYFRTRALCAPSSALYFSQFNYPHPRRTTVPTASTLARSSLDAPLDKLRREGCEMRAGEWG